jgi:hypothetical protein
LKLTLQDWKIQKQKNKLLWQIMDGFGLEIPWLTLQQRIQGKNTIDLKIQLTIAFVFKQSLFFKRSYYLV